MCRGQASHLGDFLSDWLPPLSFRKRFLNVTKGNLGPTETTLQTNRTGNSMRRHISRTYIPPRPPVLRLFGPTSKPPCSRRCVHAKYRPAFKGRMYPSRRALEACLVPDARTSSHAYPFSSLALPFGNGNSHRQVRIRTTGGPLATLLFET